MKANKKIFKSEKSTVQVEWTDSEVKIQTLAGERIQSEMVISLLHLCGILGTILTTYYGRKHQHCITYKTGYSGCKDWYVLWDKETSEDSYSRETWSTIKRKHLVHISMCDKLNEDLGPIWMGDLKDLLLENAFAPICNAPLIIERYEDTFKEVTPWEFDPKYNDTPEWASYCNWERVLVGEEFKSYGYPISDKLQGEEREAVKNFMEWLFNEVCPDGKRLPDNR
jgi:hypothetical protein